MLLLVNNFQEERITESRYGRNFGSARAVCDLHSCYMRIHSFSANQLRLFFFMYIITFVTNLSFRYFFNLLLALICIGTFNGLLFLPVFLSLAGPGAMVSCIDFSIEKTLSYSVIDLKRKKCFK